MYDCAANDIRFWCDPDRAAEPGISPLCTVIQGKWWYGILGFNVPLDTVYRPFRRREKNFAGLLPWRGLRFPTASILYIFSLFPVHWNTMMCRRIRGVDVSCVRASLSQPASIPVCDPALKRLHPEWQDAQLLLEYFVQLTQIWLWALEFKALLAESYTTSWLHPSPTATIMVSISRKP